MDLAVLILASKRDLAAQNIARELVRLKNFQPVSTTSGDLLRQGDVYLKHVDTDGIHTDSLDVDFEVDLVIFASRHRSESGAPTLTVHWPGNATSKADFGGKPKSLAYSRSSETACSLLALDEAGQQEN